MYDLLVELAKLWFFCSFNRWCSNWMILNNCLLQAYILNIKVTYISDPYQWPISVTYIINLYQWPISVTYLSDLYLWPISVTYLSVLYLWPLIVTYISHRGYMRRRPILRIIFIYRPTIQVFYCKYCLDLLNNAFKTIIQFVFLLVIFHNIIVSHSRVVIIIM